MGLIQQQSRINSNSSLIPADDISGIMHDVSKKKMRERILVTDRNTGESYYTTKGDALFDRLIDIGLYSENEKNAITAAKAALDYGFGKPGIRKEEEKQEFPEIVFKLTPTQNKELLRRSALPVPASDEDEEDAGKIIVEVEGEEGVLKYD
ncbi:MAG: hypothetical protein MJZ11_08065 [Lachnospiraceae bacterium]|nr:hypothetical protein [Lachnospiraceae bacterium]